MTELNDCSILSARFFIVTLLVRQFSSTENKKYLETLRFTYFIYLKCFRRYLNICNYKTRIKLSEKGGLIYCYQLSLLA